jgi:thioredoxin 2
VRCSKCHRDLPWLVEAGDTEFDAAVRQAPLPVLVDVWAPWCGPCRTMSPIVEQLSRELAGKIKVVKVNADEAPAAARALGVSGIPTLALFSHGAERARLVGARPAQELRRWLHDHTPANRQTGEAAR